MKGIIRIQASSPELKVGNIEFNCLEIIKTLEFASQNQVDIVLFPELSLTSYSLADLFYEEKIHYESIQALLKISLITKQLQISTIIGLPIFIDGKIFNVASFISNGKILGMVPKTYLPNTNEFYEERWFASERNRILEEIIIGTEKIPFGADLIFSEKNLNLKIGIEICEDLWVITPPSNDLSIAGANLIFNPSASPEIIGKFEYRNELVRQQSARLISGYVYASSGPNESTTDLVYSGHSMIYENGSLLAESKRFNLESESIFSDIDIDKLNQDRLKNSSYKNSFSQKKFRRIEFELIQNKKKNFYLKLSNTPFVPKDLSLREKVSDEIIQIQSTALAKRLKHTNLKKIVIGVSGGLDSTLALLVCVLAFEKLNLDKKGILAITMPGLGTSSRTKKNAIELIEQLGLSFKEISIHDSVMQHFKDIEQDENLHDITFENSQARERTQILMDMANKINGLVIGTGDMSELALGWCTYSGDHISMYAVNVGIPKTLVKYLVEYFALIKYKDKISETLKDIIATPVSPELIPPKDGKISQITEDHVGPYILHDFFMYYMLRYRFSPTKIFELAEIAFKDSYDRETILKWLKVFYSRFFSQAFKRSCLPDGPKIGSVAVSPRGDLRMPSDVSATLWLTEIDHLTI